MQLKIVYPVPEKQNCCKHLLPIYELRTDNFTVIDFLLQTRINHSRMRIHQLENINKALDFLYEEGAHLENVGAQDIVDGNPRITLGLIWTIILHYQASQF
ncbi:unnamed protein product [Schistosoma margrebowiei]|uniref:Uncharacterized protein n=1 Tax=Schistosoma margrebowiei TaxID=48269 RepID=A0A183LNN7_9TREM|nr:unnamed protein product [Schistosoma margrebowiei]